MAKLDNSGLLLSSGRFIPNSGASTIIGIHADADSVYWGYDSGFYLGYDNDWNDNPPLTAAERKEISDLMIQLWLAWANKPEGTENA